MKSLLLNTARTLMRGRTPATGYSHLGEDAVILDLLDKLGVEGRYCVDVGASDGESMSNTRSLFLAGWQGLAVEYDSLKFYGLTRASYTLPGVSLARCMVTPENVEHLLKGFCVPKDFAFLSLDIDGYDYHVLSALLRSFRPALVCAEINEKIPPPVKFTVNYSPDYSWRLDHFYGQSVAQVGELCRERDYSLVGVHYNNAFLAPSELGSRLEITPEEAYRVGYWEKPDRRKLFPWNRELEYLHALAPEEARDAVEKLFADREGEFTCRL